MESVQEAVLKRYQEGARNFEPKLCCPVTYDEEYLKILPEEILQKDYGCGDPTQYAKEGETVLDLGSGVGKNCYILAQKVKSGQVIGVDFNQEMLDVARKYQQQIADAIGYQNTKFLKGKIQDLKLDLEALETWLNQHPVSGVEDLIKFEGECQRLRQESPLVPDCSVDVVVSNCVLNLVNTDEKQKLFSEIYRVTKPGGRAVISDIVCDKTPTEKILNDPELWSGCISGAFREDLFCEMFENAGFEGVQILKRDSEPWQVVDGIEFRSMTVCAYKLSSSASCEVVYPGPWKVVQDETRTFKRGERVAAPLKYTQEPYNLIGVTAQMAQKTSCCSGKC